MKIQINTDRNLEGREALFDHIRSVVEHALSHHRDHITRVEVHLTDENGPKTGPKELRCIMEARLERHQPLAVTQDADNMHLAIDGAAEKLAHLVERTVGKLREKKIHRTEAFPAEEEIG